jgi:ABC-type transport system involved in multi-copper enzyme maturation permease subunit
MFWQMVFVEQKKLTRRKILWIELAVVAAASILLPLVFYLASQGDGSGNVVVTTDGSVNDMFTWPLSLNMAIDLASGSGLGGMLIVILIGTLTAQEYSWRTMQLWLSNGISRPVLLLAKFTIVLLPALLFVLASFVTGALTTAVFTQNLQGSLPFADVDWWQVAWRILRTAYTLLPYAALTFLLAVASRSTVVAVGVSLAYTLLVEDVLIQLLGLVGGTWVKMGQYLPAGLGSSLASLNQAEGVNMATAVTGIALYTLLFVGLAVLAFRRQDLTG